jgi:hypothetical protein
MAGTFETDALAITRREGRGSAPLWFGLLGGPLAWVTQLAVNYSLEEWFACSPGADTTGFVYGFRAPTVAFVVTLVLAVITLVAGMVSVGCYRKLQRASGSDEVSGRARWMAVAGIMNSILYFIVILASFAPPVILRVCESSP